ncbi:hypothetical protein ACJX0J_028908, partial [Zea mays]
DAGKDPQKCYETSFLSNSILYIITILLLIYIHIIKMGYWQTKKVSSLFLYVRGME